MDVDFSQIGQNAAITGLQQNVERNTGAEKDRLSVQQNSQNSTDLRQDYVRSADSNSTVNEIGNIETAVAEVSEFVQSRNRQLAFSIDEDSQRSVVKVTDSDSGEVIRQIPSEEVLALSERIKELQSDVGAAVGVLFNKQV